MPLAFNPFNPMHWWSASPLSGPFFPPQRPLPAGTPIDIRARASDAGLSISVDEAKGTITLAGTAHGPEIETGFFGAGAEYARSVSFSLDVDRAPTVDVFGETNYRRKNARSFLLYTSKGATALQCARALAERVNAAGEFRAGVTAHADGRATIVVERR